jgi:hypothetical protein
MFEVKVAGVPVSVIQWKLIWGAFAFNSSGSGRDSIKLLLMPWRRSIGATSRISVSPMRITPASMGRSGLERSKDISSVDAIRCRKLMLDCIVVK